MTDHILSAFEEDIRERLEGLEPANRTGYQVRVYEIEPGGVYEDENVRVQAFPVNHGSWPAYGYKFITPDRTIVLSGDTAPDESLHEAYRGCDVLIHEVYSSAGCEGCQPEWKRYHSSVHTSARELSEIAKRVKPRLLILYHQLFHGVSEEELLQEVQEGYGGMVVSGKDLEIY
jgi:ribonuclease BN (tRNA processing enzyme)